jgi:SAM-dependent methyltransferase
MTRSDKAALRGEPSYVWRAGQARRLAMIREAAPGVEGGRVLENGCGIGAYVARLRQFTPYVFGLDYEFERVAEGGKTLDKLICAAGEALPYPENAFDVVISNEVIEHVQDDAASLREIVRVLRRGGRLVLFCPNRWYPVETHGIYWRGRYIFGNIPLVNYLPDPVRNKLAPHVRAYTRRRLRKLLSGLPVKIVRHSIIFGGYDNLITRFGPLGKLIRAGLYVFENTPLQVLGLSHFLVVEKC